MQLGERSDKIVLGDEVEPAVLLSDGRAGRYRGWVCVVQEMGVSGHSPPYWDLTCHHHRHHLHGTESFLRS
jgi:hypothetical protein